MKLQTSHLSLLPCVEDTADTDLELREKGHDFAQTLQSIAANLCVKSPTLRAQHLSVSLELMALLLAESVAETTEHEVPELLEALRCHLLGGVPNDRLATLVAYRRAMLSPPDAVLREVQRLQQ